MKYFTKSITTLAAFATLATSAGEMGIKNAGLMGVLPGEDSSSALLPGQGHDTIIHEAMGHCVELGDFANQDDGMTPGRIAEFTFEDIRSETDLRTRLGISATLAMVAALQGAPSGRVNFVHESRINTQNRYILVKSRVANELEQATSFAYSADAKELLERTNKEEDAFTQACGNEFVYARRTGVEFYALLEFLTITHEQARRFDAAAAGEYNGWRGVADLNWMLGRFAGIAETRIHMIQLGGSRSFPQIDDLEEFARTYPSLVDASLSGAVNLELVTKNYGGVTPTYLAPDFKKTRGRATTIDEVARNREKVNDLRRAIDYIRGNLKFYQYDRRVHDFSRWLSELQSFEYANDDIARACLTANWDWCSIPPLHRVPEIQLPIRKGI